MGKTVLAIGAVWAVLYAVPFLLYGAASTFASLKPPPGSPAMFLLSVAVTKLGTAIAFVGLFALTQPRWLPYAALWFAMFAISEIGDAVKPNYSALEAAIGIAAEAIYTPLAALITDKIL